VRLNLIGSPPSLGGGRAPSITALIGSLLKKLLLPDNEKLSSFYSK
jgi:hypothetical protein